jgi:hypothetical protein
MFDDGAQTLQLDCDTALRVHCRKSRLCRRGPLQGLVALRLHGTELPLVDHRFRTSTSMRRLGSHSAGSRFCTCMLGGLRSCGRCAEVVQGTLKFRLCGTGFLLPGRRSGSRSVRTGDSGTDLCARCLKRLGERGLRCACAGHLSSLQTCCFGCDRHSGFRGFVHRLLELRTYHEVRNHNTDQPSTKIKKNTKLILGIPAANLKSFSMRSVNNAPDEPTTGASLFFLQPQQPNHIPDIFPCSISISFR